MYLKKINELINKRDYFEKSLDILEYSDLILTSRYHACVKALRGKPVMLGFRWFVLEEKHVMCLILGKKFPLFMYEKTYTRYFCKNFYTIEKQAYKAILKETDKLAKKVLSEGCN